MLRSHLFLLTPPLATSFHFQAVTFSFPTNTPCRNFNFSPHPSFYQACTKGSQRVFLGTSCLNSTNSPSTGDESDVELGRLLSLLPEEMRQKVSEHPEHQQLIEVVMDLGRKPLARFPSGDFVLSACPITFEDLEHATSQVGDFAIDNRAGISRTLHRISAIRNRKGAIIGLTCRVGRAISGSASLLRDLIKDGASLLLIGPPGVGKTTIIREIARMLANDYKKRVMIVDTSNEIAGDGDIPHAGIGGARRMQVPNTDMQHKVLIEAVENHMPQVIVIDEIGTKLEAMAASTIAQRGIQLVATAHGITIENLTMNPSLEMLVGGIQSVTLGDEEASRRGVQKTVLERKGPSTFSSGVEIISKTELRVHRSLEATVDAILSGRSPKVEVRKINSKGMEQTVQRNSFIQSSFDEDEMVFESVLDTNDERAGHTELISDFPANMGETSCEYGPLHLFVYGILEVSVIQGIKQLKMDTSIQLTDNISKADALLALQSKLKKNSRIQAAAKTHDIPIYVTKTSSLVQITKAVRALTNDYIDKLKDFGSEDMINFSQKIDALEDLSSKKIFGMSHERDGLYYFGNPSPVSPPSSSLVFWFRACASFWFHRRISRTVNKKKEARIAIEKVVIPKGEPVELLPRPSQILSLQRKLIRKYQLQAERVGTEPDVRLRILPFQTRTDDDIEASMTFDEDNEFNDFLSTKSNTNGSLYSMDRLPLLPD